MANKKNPKGAGRPHTFDIKHGKTKRIAVTIPEKHEETIKKEIDEKVLDKYKKK